MKRPWQQARPGSATARVDPSLELLTIVAFDIPNDKTRRKIGEMCLDYGLLRVQYSVFEGPMTRNRREELALRLRARIEGDPEGGRVAVYPIGEREAAQCIRHVRVVSVPEPAPEPMMLEREDEP